MKRLIFWRKVQRWVDSRIETILRKEWERLPIGQPGKAKEGERCAGGGPDCDYCGYLCGHCGRP